MIAISEMIDKLNTIFDYDDSSQTQREAAFQEFNGLKEKLSLDAYTGRLHHIIKNKNVCFAVRIWIANELVRLAKEKIEKYKNQVQEELFDLIKNSPELTKNFLTLREVDLVDNLADYYTLGVKDNTKSDLN